MRTWCRRRAKDSSLWIIERLGPGVNCGVQEAGRFEGNRRSTNSPSNTSAMRIYLHLCTWRDCVGGWNSAKRSSLSCGEKGIEQAVRADRRRQYVGSNLAVFTNDELIIVDVVMGSWNWGTENLVIWEGNSAKAPTVPWIPSTITLTTSHSSSLYRFPLHHVQRAHPCSYRFVLTSYMQHWEGQKLSFSGVFPRVARARRKHCVRV